MENKLFELGVEENVDLSKPQNSVKYKWVTEPNACKKCQALEDKLFNSVEEFEAARPHPHCKCSYEKVFINISSQAELQRLDDINAKFTDLETKSEALGEKLESALISLKMAKEFVREKIAKLDKDMKLALQELYDLAQKIGYTIDRIIHILESWKNFRKLPTQLKNNTILTLEEKEKKTKTITSRFRYSNSSFINNLSGGIKPMEIKHCKIQ